MKILLIPILLTIAFSAFCENDKTTRKGKPVSRYYEISAGISIPQYSLKYNPYGNNSGYAENGVNLLLNATTEINKKWGYKYVVSLMVHPGTENDIRLANKIIETGYWFNIHFGAGPYVNFKINKFILDLGISAGLLSSSSPFVTLNSYNKGWVRDKNVLKSGFGLGISFLPGVSLNYKISEKKSFKLYFNYMIAPVSMNYKYGKARISTQTWDKWSDEKSISNGKVRYLCQSLNMGIGFIF